MLSPSNDIELITPPAQELLAAMRSPALATVPTPVLALAGFTRSRSHDPDRQPDTVAVPTPSGWITLHASLPEGSADGRVAIVLERTASPQTTAIRLEAHGVTAREREIATLLAHGLTNPEIAARLVLSLYTVQDHIKNLFEKTGVSSRQELVARIFLDDYLPQLAQRTPLTSSGGFARNTTRSSGRTPTECRSPPLTPLRRRMLEACGASRLRAERPSRRHKSRRLLVRTKRRSDRRLSRLPLSWQNAHPASASGTCCNARNSRASGFQCLWEAANRGGDALAAHRSPPAGMPLLRAPP